jgi:hypothetical protein
MRTPSRSDRQVATTAVTSSPDTNLKRRRFLLGLGAGGAGAATVAIGAMPALATAEPAADVSNQGGNGYRETEHVRDYYRTAKL